MDGAKLRSSPPDIKLFKENDIPTIRFITYVLKEVAGLDENTANEWADNLSNLFGYKCRLLDNLLGPKGRDMIYFLQDYGIFKEEKEEEIIYDGRPWRIRHWVFDKESIFDKLNGKKEFNYVDEVLSLNPKRNYSSDEAGVYDDLSEEAWAR